jgi:hypothetical protein
MADTLAEIIERLLAIKERQQSDGLCKEEDLLELSHVLQVLPVCRSVFFLE